MNKVIISIYFFVGLIAIGCNQNATEHQQDESDIHADHADQINILPTISYTNLSEDYELFVEFPPLVVGELSAFTTFLTYLPDYKPVTDGKLIVSLILGNKGIRYTTDQPTSPGIFHSRLQPKEAGICKLKFEWQHGEKNYAVEINDVEVYANTDLALKSTSNPPEANEITFPIEKAWTTEFAIKKINKGDFREVISTSGQIMPASGDENTIVSPFSGIVTTMNSIVEGKYVKHGQKLLSLSGKGLASDNISVHYTHLKSNFEKAKADYDRVKALVENKIVSQKEFTEAKSVYEKAKADFDNAGFTSDGVINDVTANLSGYIKDILVTDGQFVQAGTPLIKIAQNKRLLIRADVSQNHWHCLPDIVEANFITPYDSRLYNTAELNGKLVSYSRNASNSVWSTPVFFEINNKGNLIPGTYIEVFLLSKPIPNTIAIPISSLIEDQGNLFVFIQLSGEKYQKREVKTGSNNGREIEIISGIEKGEIIVTKGVYQVKLASVSSTLPASHGHNH